jgi:hypothetical protein
LKKLILVSLVVVVLLIQLVPVSRDNPPATAALSAPPAVAEVLHRSCFDCHSHETVWPWYSYVAPVSWLVAHDVHEGREHLNFSAWNEYPAAKQLKLAHEIWEEVSEGDMPLGIYLLMHGDAKLSGDDLEAIRVWTKTLRTPPEAVPSTP